MSEKNTVRVWLGYRASIWSHRGYTVRGESVYTDSLSDAKRIVGDSLPFEPVAVRADDSIYYYHDQADADRDDDGSGAYAVILWDEEIE